MMAADTGASDPPWAPVRLRVAVCVEHEARILLVFDPVYRGGCWIMPGGAAEFAETVVEAAEREVLEETGITVKVDELLYLRELWEPETDFDGERPARRKTFEIAFSGQYVAGSIRTDWNPSRKRDGIARVREVRWVPVAEFGPVIEGHPFHPLEILACLTRGSHERLPITSFFLPPLKA